MAISPRGEPKGAGISIAMVLPLVPELEAIDTSVWFCSFVRLFWSYSILSVYVN